MNKHTSQYSYAKQDKARINVAARRPRRRWVFIWVFLTALFWVVSPAAYSEESGRQNANSKQNGKQTGKENNKGPDAPSKDQEGGQDSDAAAPEDLFDVFTRWSQAAQKDPNSAEARELEKELNAVMGKLERSMKIAPEARLERPPAGLQGVLVPDTAEWVEATAPTSATRAGDSNQPTGIEELTESEELAESEDLAESEQPGQGEAPVEAEESAEEILARLLAEAEALQAAEEEIAPTKVAEAEGDEAVQAGAEPNVVEGYPTVEPKPASPNDIVKIKMQDNLLDINMLIETVGKELKFTFLYDTPTGISGQVKLQQYGEIRRRDLLPLLESMLNFQGLSMIRQDPFIRIVKRAESLKKTALPLTVGPELPPAVPGDMVVAQLLELEHVKINEVQSLLDNFTDAKLVAVPNSNYVILTDLARRTPRLLEMIDLIDQPGPEKRLEVMPVVHLEAKTASAQVGALIKDLSEQGASGAAPAPAPAKPAPSKGRPRRPSRKAPTPPKAVGGKIGAKGPILHVDERTNRLLVIGTDEQIDQVRHILSLLDVAQPGVPIRLKVVQIEHVPSKEITGQLDNLLKALSEETDQPGSATEAPKDEEGKKPPAKRRPSRRAKPSTTGVKSEAGPYLLTDERTNRLFVVGSDEQLAQVEDLMRLLDVPAGPAIELTALQIEHVLSKEIVTQLGGLIKALSEDTSGTTESGRRPGAAPKAAPRRPARRDRSGGAGELIRTGETGPYLLSDDRTNRLLVVGSAEQIEQVKELLVVLDVPPYEYEQAEIRVYQPQHVEAAEALRILDQLGITKPERVSPREQARQRGGVTERARQPIARGGAESRGEEEESMMGPPGSEEPEIRTAVQESTNKIFVLATKEQHRDIELIMTQVDMEAKEALGAIRIYTLENREPGVVAGMLQDLLESEKLDVEQKVAIPGKEGAPIIVALEDIYAVAVRGSKKQHEEIGEIIKVLDKRLPQVLVEAILVQVNSSDVLNLGIALQESRSVGGPRRVSGISPFGLSAGSPGASQIVTGTGGVLAFFDDELVFATLEALQTQLDGKVVSKPRILVNDNESGSITSQREEPTTETTIQPGSDTPIVAFKDYVTAGTTLSITPHISEGNFLQLEIQLNVDSFDGLGSGNIPPPKQSNEIDTLVTVPDGKTIVLGGLTNQNDSVTINKIPLLGDIPLVGSLFRNVSRSETNGVLYVFVRAHIVRSREEEGMGDFRDLDELSEKDRMQLRQSERNYQKQSLIPGIPDARKKEQRGALED